ncbi:MAG TPA: glycoside hydrolase family 3 N-terminal domain-containing protein, partial [Desulfuromonadales bacterium]|nr:glycoside hydrolase family 3 N-terminal domain-containing protein [Desulfuromonadales bacterium]
MIASGDCRILLRLCAGLAAVLLLGGCAPGASPQKTAAAVSLDDKIAQMLMVGFRGTRLEEAPFILRDLRRRNLGGVILFDYDILQKRAGRNIASPDQLKALVASLQAAADTPLLVAVDQEGGRVSRLAERSGFPPTVSHGGLGEIDDLETTSRRSARLAATLAEMGIGLNLAP